MNLIGLDAAFVPIATLSCLNIQWNRRYYEAGDFLLQLRAADYHADIAYVYTPDRPETGMVQKVETERTVKGDFVLLSGYFLEGMLNWKVAYPRVSLTGNVAALCRAQVTQRFAEQGVAVPAGQACGGEVTVDALGDALGDLLGGLLKLFSLGQRICLNHAENQLRYEVWQGLNRTQSQSVNAYAVFSQGFGNVDSITLTRDDSALRNYAIAAYREGEIVLDIRASPALPKRELYMDTALTAADFANQSALHAAVRTAAQRELAKHAGLINIDATVLGAGERYLRDYDLGDLCDVRDDRLGLAFETRIIEVNEVWKEGAHQVWLQFGDRIPTAYPR